MSDPLASLKELFQELRRRHVIRVGAVYVVVAWILMQVASTVFPALQLPDWTTTLVVVLSLFGFPLAVILAWAFEMTPEGVRRTPPPKTTFAPPEDEDVGGLFRRLSSRLGGSSGSAGGPSGTAAPKARPRDTGGRTVAAGVGYGVGVKPWASPGTEVGAPEVAPAGLPEREVPDAERVRRASLSKLRHDLRSPINAVVGYAEMLLEEGVGEDDPETGDDLRKIREAGKELQGVVDDVLSPEALDRHRRRAESGDADEFAQDLQHRLRTPLNAVIGYGELILEREREAGGNRLASDVDRILSAGRQLLGRTDEIIRFCTAEVRGAATPDDYDRVSSLAREALSRIRAVEPGDSEAVAVAGAALLVVDDSELNRELLTRRLALQGFTVSTARDGREGLERMRSQPFDLVLLDILMPEMDGVEVLSRMKADEELRDIPVIMISALDEVDTTVRCMEAGAADYVSKPFDPVLLAARVAAALRTRELHRASRRYRNELRLREELVERLVYARFPESVARRVRRGVTEIADRFEEASVLCVQFVGLPGVLARSEPIDGLRRLQAVRQWLRELAAERDVETLICSHLECVAVAGVPNPIDDHAESATALALDMLEGAAAVGRETGLPLRLRMGLHAGPVTAAVAGEAALSYEVWGETVQMARRLESAGVPDAVHVSGGLEGRLRHLHDFESRGVVDLGEAGQMRTYLLRGGEAR